jgi:hypothetical protein
MDSRAELVLLSDYTRTYCRMQTDLQTIDIGTGR